MNKTTIDLSVGAGAISVPWWIHLTSGLELVIAVGGVTLIGLRLVMAFKEWRNRE